VEFANYGTRCLIVIHTSQMALKKVCLGEAPPLRRRSIEQL